MIIVLGLLELKEPSLIKTFRRVTLKLSQIMHDNGISGLNYYVNRLINDKNAKNLIYRMNLYFQKVILGYNVKYLVEYYEKKINR